VLPRGPLRILELALAASLGVLVSFVVPSRAHTADAQRKTSAPLAQAFLDRFNARLPVCDLQGAAVTDTWSRSDAPPNASGSPLRVWPFDGVQAAPTRWNGGETPDPLAGMRLKEFTVGPVIFV
jgi:hypothetical protein